MTLYLTNFSNMNRKNRLELVQKNTKFSSEVCFQVANKPETAQADGFMLKEPEFR